MKIVVWLVRLVLSTSLRFWAHVSAQSIFAIRPVTAQHDSAPRVIFFINKLGPLKIQIWLDEIFPPTFWLAKNHPIKKKDNQKKNKYKYFRNLMNLGDRNFNFSTLLFDFFHSSYMVWATHIALDVSKTW